MDEVLAAVIQLLGIFYAKNTPMTYKDYLDNKVCILLLFTQQFNIY